MFLLFPLFFFKVRRRIDSDSRHQSSLTRAMVSHCPPSPRCHLPLLVRLSFILANLTASSASNRAALGRALPHLLALLEFHTELLLVAMEEAEVCI